MNVVERGAYVYARVKATMALRTFGDLPNPAGLRPRRLRVLAAAFAALLLTLFAGASGAGVAQYSGTLYLDGPGSAVGSGNYQLSVTAPPVQGAAPTAAAGVAGSGGPSGSFVYVYAVNSGGVVTASPLSNSVSPSNAAVTVSGIPAGADLYRQQTSAGAPNRQMILIASGVGPVYVDTSTATTGTALPQSDNRAATGFTGWIEFAPGNSLATNSATTAGSTTLPSPTTCSGWIVDGAGGVSLPAGTWTVTARVRSGALANGAAVLSVGAYVVDASGNVVSTVFPPTDGAQQIQNVPNPGIVASVSATTSSVTNIGSSEHLCLMFWRHQTTAYTLASANRYITLVPYDPSNAITIHPAPNSTPVATLASPADALRTTSTPTLSATYTDVEPDAGNLTIRLCADSGCSSSLQNSGALAATNGETKTWTPTGALADGTYYWQAQAADAVGTSAWTSSRSFVIDTTGPTTTIDSAPTANSNAASGSFSFSANESVTGFQCRIDGASFAGCTSPHAYGPLADGTHTFDVKATADLVGNAGTTTSYGWTVDTVPPNTTITGQPSSLSNSASPSFSFTSTQSGSTFECRLDGGAFSACSSPKTYSSVADGAHTFEVRAIDPAGNADATPDSYGWTIDATPPDTSIGAGAPAALTTSTGGTFTFAASEAGSSFQCSLDGAPFSACSTPKTYSGLGDGSHTFQVRATDAAANVDPTPAAHTWTIDTRAPVTSLGPTVPAANTSSTSATFDVSSNEGGSTFECRLDGGLFGACTPPVSYSGLATGTHTFEARATDAIGNVDATPASYTWRIDTVVPDTPIQTSPADALATNSLPQLRATFSDPSPGGDSGEVEFQLCSSSAPAGSACAPVVQSVTSSSVSSGATASATPAALPDGTYHWQVRGRDAAGNLSGWSATRSFQLDTLVPSVAADAPADGATMRSVQLKATFQKPSFAGTGTVEFRVCSDGLCLGIVRTGSSSTLVNGAQATWSPATPLSDGLWYWQARSVDSVGNASAWSPVRVLYVDTVAPGKPLNFRGDVDANGLRLRWDAPNDNVANYVLYVNGAVWKNLATTETDVQLGAFDANDTRTFSVQAIDTAGNVGAMSAVLVGVPDLVGSTWVEALNAAGARGLELRRSGVTFKSIATTIVKQEPPAPAVVARGTVVHVTMAAAEAPLAVAASPKRIVCASGSSFRLRVQLSAPALVRNRLVNMRGRIVKRGAFGTLRAGTTKVRVKLPRGLRRGDYRLVLDARGAAGTAHAVVRVKVGSRTCRGA